MIIKSIKMMRIRKKKDSIGFFGCEYCDYVWTPRTESPKSCPRCKRHFKDFRDRRKPENVVNRK
jgi:rubrerythrin